MGLPLHLSGGCPTVEPLTQSVSTEREAVQLRSATVLSRIRSTANPSRTSSTRCALFRGKVVNGRVGVGLAVGVALIVVGMAFGTRTFHGDAA
jgi:hypothetical protein